MISIKFHRREPLWIPYDVYTKYIGVSALTIVIRVRLDFHCRVIFPCVRA